MPSVYLWPSAHQQAASPCGSARHHIPEPGAADTTSRGLRARQASEFPSSSTRHKPVEASTGLLSLYRGLLRPRPLGCLVWSTALESAYPKLLAGAWAQCASQATFGTDSPPRTSHQRALFEPRFERCECITSSEILKWGPLSPPCAPPAHLSFPKGTKITHLQ